MRKFKVHVVGFNANTFRDIYHKYIIDEYDTYFDDTIFELAAPQKIYNEIDNLKEELISILKN